jgi:hypothetical protein
VRDFANKIDDWTNHSHPQEALGLLLARGISWRPTVERDNFWCVLSSLRTDEMC